MEIYNTIYGKAYHGDCLKIIKQLDNNSIDTLITDPPAGINFMGKEWDHHKGGRQKWVDYMTERFSEALRVIKPGGLALVWALPRTAHWTAIALEDAGWYIDTKMYFLFGCGWPKSLDISKGIDRYLGCEREKAENPLKGKQTFQNMNSTYKKLGVETIEPIPVHPQAKKWDGYKTQLKPMCEEWIVCRKPVDKNFVNNALVYGVAGYNIDGCRIKTNEILQGGSREIGNDLIYGKTNPSTEYIQNTSGRYPGNVIIDDEVAENIDSKIGKLCEEWIVCRKPVDKNFVNNALVHGVAGYNIDGCRIELKNELQPTGSGAPSKGVTWGFHGNNGNITNQKGRYPGNVIIDDEVSAAFRYGDGSGASRFFTRCNFQEVDYYYGGKAAGSEKHTDIKNIHPTVKSIELMRYLCKLSKPPDNGVILDIFAGTFSTALAAFLENREFIVIEEKKEYCEIGLSRLKAAMGLFFNGHK